ncbi:SRPBCC family protein [Flavicella marina]|uniref:SRPBCC family protein n=1 Tax=Flavicella marina TaxID=1475951 RepID=UPI0012642122|nr:SRPBCC family protein [Flavicella marina]
MKTIKKLGVILALIIATPFIIALFTAKDYSVERSIAINQPKQFVFDYIKYLKNQDNYSKWATMDPDMKKTFSGIDGTVGFISAWDSDNDEVGKGEQEILSIDEGRRIDFELRFFEPFQSTETGFMTTKQINDTTTQVTWGFKGHMDYPMNLMLLVMDFEKMLGDDFDYSLNQLKKILEK